MARTIVLRDRARRMASHPFSGSRFRSSALPALPPEPSLESAQLSKRDLAELHRDPEVVAMAPVTPLRLIAPVGKRLEVDAGKVGVAWGVDAVGASTSPYTGKGITVAVLDTGIDASHPAFAGVEIVEKDFTGEGNGDFEGHGTHCAGTICGRKIGNARIGVAMGVERVLAGKVLGAQGGDTDALSQAILWAIDNGAHVVSMSLGFDFPGLAARLQNDNYPPDLATAIALEGYRATLQLFSALAHLVDVKGTAALFAAAGNESHREINPMYEVSVAPPAAGEGFISVGALESSAGSLTVARFSNTGPDICGPGVDVVSAKAGGGLCSLSGTSMATPHVAGVAALWAQKLLETTGAVRTVPLKACVLGRATRQGIRPTEDSADLGVGLVQAPQAG